MKVTVWSRKVEPADRVSVYTNGSSDSIGKFDGGLWEPHEYETAALAAQALLENKASGPFMMTMEFPLVTILAGLDKTAQPTDSRKFELPEVGPTT